MVREYAHEPLMWDTMARRELRGLVQPSITDTPMELDNTEQTTHRDRISACNKVYQTAVKKIKNEELWSLYMECLLEINQDLSSLPNFKRKLLKTALAQGHQVKKLREKYYLHWVCIQIIPVLCSKILTFICVKDINIFTDYYIDYHRLIC